jgi:hypothetical protein
MESIHGLYYLSTILRPANFHSTFHPRKLEADLGNIQCHVRGLEQEGLTIEVQSRNSTLRTTMSNYVAMAVVMHRYSVNKGVSLIPKEEYPRDLGRAAAPRKTYHRLLSPQ